MGGTSPHQKSRFVKTLKNNDSLIQSASLALLSPR